MLETAENSSKIRRMFDYYQHFRNPCLQCELQKAIQKIMKNRKNTSKVVKTSKNVMFGPKPKFGCAPIFSTLLIFSQSLGKGRRLASLPCAGLPWLSAWQVDWISLPYVDNFGNFLAFRLEYRPQVGPICGSFVIFPNRHLLRTTIWAESIVFRTLLHYDAVCKTIFRLTH